MRWSRRRKVTEIRRTRAYLIDCLKIKRKSRFVGYCKQMQYAVARTAQCHIASKRVADRLLIDNISCLYVSLYKIHNCHTCVFCKRYSCAHYCRYSAVTGQCNTYSLAKTVHRICCIHTGAGAAGWTAILFVFKKFFIVYHIGFPCADCLKHF